MTKKQGAEAEKLKSVGKKWRQLTSMATTNGALADREFKSGVPAPWLSTGIRVPLQASV
jgi:hypothetical protein